MPGLPLEASVPNRYRAEVPMVFVHLKLDSEAGTFATVPFEILGGGSFAGLPVAALILGKSLAPAAFGRGSASSVPDQREVSSA